MAFGSQHEQNPVAGKTCVLCDVDTSEYTFDILSSKQIKKETKEKKREEKKNTRETHLIRSQYILNLAKRNICLDHYLQLRCGFFFCFDKKNKLHG